MFPTAAGQECFSRINGRFVLVRLFHCCLSNLFVFTEIKDTRQYLKVAGQLRRFEFGIAAWLEAPKNVQSPFWGAWNWHTFRKKKAMCELEAQLLQDYGGRLLVAAMGRS